ncbi:MAG: hypothetical protein R3C29_02810 [Dehalococcoidia bacterium]
MNSPSAQQESVVDLNAYEFEKLVGVSTLGRSREGRRQARPLEPHVPRVFDSPPVAADAERGAGFVSEVDRTSPSILATRLNTSIKGDSLIVIARSVSTASSTCCLPGFAWWLCR